MNTYIRMKRRIVYIYKREKYRCRNDGKRHVTTTGPAEPVNARTSLRCHREMSFPNATPPPTTTTIKPPCNSLSGRGASKPL